MAAAKFRLFRMVADELRLFRMAADEITFHPYGCSGHVFTWHEDVTGLLAITFWHPVWGERLSLSSQPILFGFENQCVMKLPFPATVGLRIHYFGRFNNGKRPASDGYQELFRLWMGLSRLMWSPVSYRLLTPFSWNTDNTGNVHCNGTSELRYMQEHNELSVGNSDEKSTWMHQTLLTHRRRSGLPTELCPSVFPCTPVYALACIKVTCDLSPTQTLLSLLYMQRQSVLCMDVTSVCVCVCVWWTCTRVNLRGRMCLMCVLSARSHPSNTSRTAARPHTRLRNFMRTTNWPGFTFLKFAIKLVLHSFKLAL